MAFRWVDPKGGRSFDYPTEAAARTNAIYNVRVRAGVPAERAGRALDKDLEDTLWKSMKHAGWKIEVDV
jgi:hypothetical protein